jgi:predicted nucleic acid-binding protein
MRVILDANVLRGALIAPHASPDVIYRAWRGGLCAVIDATQLRLVAAAAP